MSRHRENNEKVAFVTNNQAGVPTLKNAVPRRGSNLIGRTIQGKYRILEPLAKGGMGQIYKAEQIVLGRKVAIKVMHDIEQDNLEKRFFLEASMHAKLEHPNTVRIFDFGRTEDKLIYIVMELLNGHTLKSEIDQGPIETSRIINLAMQLCGALNEAHERKIVHRDIKPSNIFLVQHEETFVKLLDFGLVKSLSNSTSLSQAGMIMGSPMYMAPEQVEGKPIDARTDIYGLGMTLYEAICGHPPFSGELNQVLMAHIVKMPPSFSTHLKEETVNKNLEWIIFKAIQKNPNDRFKTIQQMRQALKLCSEALKDNKERSLEIRGHEVLSQLGAQREIESLSQSQLTRFTPNQGLQDTIKPTPMTTKRGFPKWFPTLLIICAVVTLFAGGMVGGVILYERQLAHHQENVEKDSRKGDEQTLETTPHDTSKDATDTEQKDMTHATISDVEDADDRNGVERETLSVQLRASRKANVFEIVAGKRIAVDSCPNTPCSITLQENESKKLLLKRSRYEPKTITIDGSIKDISVKLSRIKRTDPQDPLKPLVPEIFND